MLGLKSKPKSAPTSSAVAYQVVASAAGQLTAGEQRPRDEALRIFSDAVRGAEAKRDFTLPGFRIVLVGPDRTRAADLNDPLPTVADRLAAVGYGGQS